MIVIMRVRTRSFHAFHHPLLRVTSQVSPGTKFRQHETTTDGSSISADGIVSSHIGGTEVLYELN